MCCQLVAKFGFDQIQIFETSFVLDRTNNMDHINFC